MFAAPLVSPLILVKGGPTGPVGWTVIGIIVCLVVLGLVSPPKVSARRRPDASRPDSASDSPISSVKSDTHQSLEPRTIEPSPALSYPATRSQQWRQKRYWVVRLFALGFVLIVVQGFVQAARGHGNAAALVLLTPFALFLCVVAYLVDEVPRQKRLLRKSPWVEYLVANVRDTAYTKVGRVNVTFLDADEREHSYQMDPNDDDFERGDRPIWFAGSPGKQWAVLSLRQGDCTGMGYTRWVGSIVGTRVGASAAAARRTTPPPKQP